jgi:4-amino-4-deoxy-L-arabinose transferase-like glycosyltransferase
LTLVRQRPTSRRDDRRPEIAPLPNASEQTVELRLVLTVVAFLVALLIYLILFYRGEYADGLARYESLLLALVPDQLVEQWFGRPTGRVTVLDRVPLVVAALGIWGTAYLAGRLALNWLALDTLLSRLERVVFALAVGLSGISLFTLVVGLLGGLQSARWYIAAAVALAIATAWMSVKHGRAAAEKGSVGEFERSWPTIALWLAVPFVAVLLLGSLLPPVDFDVLEYHLQVPKEWYQQGRITFLSHNVYGNMPLGAEILSLPAMALLPGEDSWWWGALVGKLLIASFAPITALGIYAAGNRFAGTTAGVVAALVYISTPWVAVVSMNGLIDGVLACYLFLSVYAFAIWHSEGKSSQGLILLSGFLAGSALACKYPALLFVVLPLSIAFAWPRDGGRSRRVLLFALAVTLGGGLWLGKNAVCADNPTYPLLYSVFGGETRTDAKDAQWRQAHQVPPDVRGQRYSLPQAWNSLVNVLGRSRWQSPLLVPLMFLVFLSATARHQARYWLLFAGYFLVCWWLFTHRIDRFWVPLLPVLALLAGLGAGWSSSRLWQQALWSILGVLLISNLLLFISPLVGRSEYFVSLQQLRDDPEFSQMSAAHRYLNANVAADAKVLLVGDAALFDLTVPAEYNTCFDDCVLEQMMKGKTLEQRRASLRAAGISHVYVNWAELRRYRATYGYSDFVTPAFIHDELVERQQLLRPVQVPNLDAANGEMFEVRAEP